MRVLCIMGAFYLAALVFLWAGRRGNVSRKLAVVVSAVCLLAGSGALAAAVYPWGNSYGVTVNRLQDLPGKGVVPAAAAAASGIPQGNIVLSMRGISKSFPGTKAL